MPVKRPPQSHLAVAALLAVGSAGACSDKLSLGADCLTAAQACAGKQCGEACLACSTPTIATPDVVGHCGADGACSEAQLFCEEVSAGGAAGIDGSSGSGGALSACGKAGAPTGVQTDQTILVDGQSRTYVLSVPSDYAGTTPLALVFVWHGANLSGSLARALFNLESTVNGSAILVYPDGLPIGGATGWDLSAGSADFRLFEDLLSRLSSDYCIDSNRIFSTGHSTGAMMTNDLGCYYGDVLRAVAPVAGMPPNTVNTVNTVNTACTGNVAALVAHGSNDPTVALSQGEASRDFWLTRNGCSPQTATWPSEPACVEYQGCEPDLPVVWCVHDGGHSWPSLNYGCDSGTCIDGGAAIWAFFSSFP